MKFKIKKCEHLESFNASSRKVAEKYECKECVEIGSHWVHLRTCQSCGVTLCCDSSPNKHASKHAAGYGHGIVTSAEPRENWAWCYKDEIFMEF